MSDPSKGLMAKKWRMRYINGEFILDAPSTAPEVVYVASQVQDFSFTFDQNMKLFLTFTDDTGAWYWWYDATVLDYVLVSLPAGTVTPKCSLDDKRFHQIYTSDIILAYVRAGGLYYVQQRDRFGVEYLLQSDIGGRLVQVGMNRIWRFQFEIGD